jgi:quercetin dioxygenase-like cupin family protein
MFKVSLLSVLSAGISAAMLFIGAAILPNLSTIGTAQTQPPTPQIIRNTLLDTTVELEAGLYHMTVAELNLDPRAETPVHMHPGPSVGYVESGRLEIALSESGEVATYSIGSAFDHPWDQPHVMSNNSDSPAKMLSFEMNPISR